MNIQLRLVRIKPGLYVNTDTSDFRWHGWLCDVEGIALRRATEKQYQLAVKRKAKLSRGKA